MHFRSIVHAHDTKNYYLRLNIQMSSNLISNSTVFFTCFYNRKCTTNFFAKNKVQFLYYVRMSTNIYIQWYTLWNMIKIFLMTCKKEWIDVAIMLKAVIGKLTSQNSKKLNGYRLNILLSKVVVPQKFANSWKFHKRWIVLFH